jgi:pantothenate kinase
VTMGLSALEPPLVADVSALLARARALAATDGRTLLGVTGAPGAGKSTLAQAIADHVGERARVVGMDGFHLSQSRLARLDRSDRKGAPDTFDAAGFVTLVRRLRERSEDVVYAPEFRREIEEPIAGAVAIESDVGLVVLEGNYLLVADEPWSQLRWLLDEVWYCERDERARVAGLIARHRAYGKSDVQARRWALGSDRRNAELIATTRPRADLVARLDGQLPGAPAV